MADIILAKKINGNVEFFYPKTRSDLVVYNENQTISEKLNEIISSMQSISDRLGAIETKVQALETNVVKVPTTDVQ